MDSSIAKLVPVEILLEVFEWVVQDPDARLIHSLLCCKKWRPLAQSVLYRDVFLNSTRLVKFLSNRADQQIRSLTLQMTAIPLNPFDPSQAAGTAKTRLEALERLCPHLRKMHLLSFSISLNFPLPFTASREISSLLDNLPDSCTSLEIDMTHTGLIKRDDIGDYQMAHVCDSIRAILPRLVNLRLRRPQICSVLLGVDADNANYEAASAPKLESCIINLSLREPGPLSQSASRCGGNLTQVPYVGALNQFPSALPPLLRGLQDFASMNSANLQRLMVIDVQAKVHDQPHGWAGWVRRDLLAETSVPIPVANIGGFKKDARLARIPTEQRETADWMSSVKNLEAVVEGHAWSETATGIRLPTHLLRGYERVSRALSRAQFAKERNISCMLWVNEKACGERLLPEGPGPLMKEWVLNERIPSGWKRDGYTGSSLVRNE